MELVIHIGPHKTGTTAVQTAFANARNGVKRQGVLYPKCNWLFPAQHRLAFALKRRGIPGADTPDRQIEMDALLGAISRFQGRAVFISSEEFFACPPEAIGWLRDRLAMPVRVVTFLRRPDNFLISCYNQKIKQPGNGFSAPITRFVNAPRKIAPEIDFLGCVTAWADVFGDAAMALETYEVTPPLPRLRQLLALQGAPADPGVQINASVPGTVAEVMRHAKAIGMDIAQQRSLLDHAQRLFAAHPGFVVPDADRLRIINTLEGDLDVLFARFGKTNPYRAEAFQPVPSPRAQNAHIHDVMRLVEALL